MKWLPLFILFPIAASAVWSPPTTNTYDWMVPGIPGGIPFRTDVHTAVSAGASLATLNSAISGAATNKVVWMDAGDFTFSSRINCDNKQGLTLRGTTNANGYPTTIINSSASSIIGFNPAGFTYSGAIALSSGYTKGSTSIVFSSALTSGFSPGNLVQIRADGVSGGHYITAGGVADLLYSNHKILTTNGTTLTFTPELAMEFASGQNPEALNLGGGPGARWCGIEDVVINASGGALYAIEAWGVYALWTRNVVISNITDSGVFIYGGSQCEVRHSTGKNAAGTPSNTDGYFTQFRNGTSFSLIEDCIIDKMFLGWWDINGTMANVAIYNFVTNCTAQGVTIQIPGFRSNHGPAPVVHLDEGNVAEGFQAEGYHGSDSHRILFRNWLHGLSTTGTGNRMMVNLCRGAYWYVVVGNILGDDDWSGPGTFNFEMTGEPGYTDQSVIYRIGYPNTLNNGLADTDDDPNWVDLPTGWPDPKVAATLLRHGNYDYKTAGIINSNGLDTTLPNSLKYTEKPSYFGICPWPPFDPANPSLTNPTNIPAGYRYIFGVDPPAAAAGGPAVLYRNRGKARAGANSPAL